jgi:NADH:ubiquinone oxidoreductase subunit 6 (subunit J)
MIVQTALLIGLVLFSVLAILLRDLLKSAISLAAASLLLGIIFFRMNAPYAGVFEISVVAGLITVLFILTIALTKAGDEVRESRVVNWVFPLFFIAFIIIDALVMKGLLRKIPALASGAETGTFGDVLWKGRTFDLVGQIAVILAGVFAVLALFRKGDKHD